MNRLDAVLDDADFGNQPAEDVRIELEGMRIPREVVWFLAIPGCSDVGVSIRLRDFDHIRAKGLSRLEFAQIHRRRLISPAATALHVDGFVDQDISKFERGWVLKIEVGDREHAV